MAPDRKEDRRRIPLKTVETQAPAVVSCEGCGVCCREQPFPPFLDDIDLLPRDLQQEMLELQKREDELWRLGRPCTWFDESTGKCRHHEHRPNICRNYDIGSELCLEVRERFGIGRNSSPA